MSILVNFEDTYGIADIACHNFLGQFMDSRENEIVYNDVIIRRALSSGNIFSYKTIPLGIDEIVFVYDMDRQSNKAEYNILYKTDLEEKIKKLSSFYKNIKLSFVPTVFAAETISIHLLQEYTYDYSTIFSRNNTAHLHTQILTDILARKHNDVNNNKYWFDNGMAKPKLKIKNTRLFMNDYGKIEDTYNILTEKNYLKFNEALFKWLSGKDISNTSSMLNSTQALELQSEYNNEFNNFINNNESKIMVQGVTYDLNINYK